MTTATGLYEAIKRQLKPTKVKERKPKFESLDDLVGECWFFRTVTYHLVGRVEKRIENLLLLSEASWVADSGRFTQAIKEGKLDEVEPVGWALINLNAVTDAFPWEHDLPKEQTK